MANKYETMSLTALKEEAKSKGLKNFSSMRKQELVDALDTLAEENNASISNSKISVVAEFQGNYNTTNTLNASNTTNASHTTSVANTTNASNAAGIQSNSRGK